MDQKANLSIKNDMSRDPWTTSFFKSHTLIENVVI